MKLVGAFILVSLVSMCKTSTALAAKSQDYHAVSFSWQAHAPNAGGQQSYSLRKSSNTSDWGLFLNRSLTTNSQDLLGAVYAKRYALCASKCPLMFFGQLGGGISNGGPLIEIGWSITALWFVRVDFLTQYYLSQTRLISWSYPLWFGISIPLF